jgi:hypothetical protein|tara:strand:+ start:569 stop:2362 length:1794 start_codon:yes stop_codon:yes gene_type:complete
MNIKILFYTQKVEWDKKWIFLGKSYQNLLQVEKKISGKRIKIHRDLHLVFKKELKNYVKWIEQQRKSFKDSPYWWMNDLAGKNNIYSDFLLFICQIKTLKKILSQNYKEKDLLIICDDISLMNSIISNLKNKNLTLDYSIKILKIKNSVSDYFKILKSLIVSFINSFYWFFLSILNHKKKTFPSGDQILIHHYTTKSILLKEKINSRYFPTLESFLEKKKKNYNNLFWFYPFWSNRLKCFNNIKVNKGLIPEEYINFFDYLSGYKNIFKTFALIKQKNKYLKTDISHLIKREKINYLINSIYNLRFWLYLPAIKKYSKNCKSLTIIDHYENMIFEHALIIAVRNLRIPSNIIGYHHTLSSKEFTAWHSVKSEWKSKFKPDKVLTCGKISYNLLLSQGLPKSKLKKGPALRFNIPVLKKNQKKINYILFPLSQNKDSSFELLSCVKYLSKILSQTDYHFIIKPHPNYDIKRFLRLLKMESLPKNIKISHRNLDDLLKECLFSVILSTGASYNALLNGCIVFSLSSQLHLVDNYLDIFQTKFKFLKSQSANEIGNELKKIINNKHKLNILKSKYDKLSKFIRNKFTKKNDNILSQFTKI